MNGYQQGPPCLVRNFLLIVSLLVFAGGYGASAVPHLAEIKAAAEAGDAQAQDSLAEAYRRQFDHANARIWYSKAAAQGVANSQYQLAQTLLFEATAPWIKVDSKTARAAEGVELLRRAAQQDHQGAQLHLGRLYQEGKVVPQDLVEAYQWFAIVGRDGPWDINSMQGRSSRDRLILKMTQAQIAEGEARAKSFVAGTPSSAQVTQPSYLRNLKLQGISGTPQRRLAIINGQTFEAGEAGPIKVGGFWVYLECLSITTNCVQVRLKQTGTAMELKLGEPPATQTHLQRQSRPAPVKQAAASQLPPQKPVRQKVSPQQLWQVSTPLPKSPDPAKLLTAMARKMAWIAACGVVIATLFIVGIVTVVPVVLQRLTSPFQSRAQAYRSDPRSPFPKPAQTGLTTKRPDSLADLMDQLMKIDWFQFEQVAEIVFRKRGYEVERCGGANPDGGVDLFVRKDGHQQAIQCKHWRHSDVGVKTVREFLGAMRDAGIEKGMFVALGGYTEPARELAAKHGIELIDGTRLTAMLKDVDARYDPEIIALLDDQRKFCPKCGNEMVIRTAQKGRNTGSTFWGCTRFPRCNFILRS